MWSNHRSEQPLAAASKITAKGNQIVLDDANSDSYIEDKASGVRIPITLEDGIYMMEMVLEDNVMSLKKEGNKETLKFEIHNFGTTDSIIKETKAFFKASGVCA